MSPPARPEMLIGSNLRSNIVTIAAGWPVGKRNPSWTTRTNWSRPITATCCHSEMLRPSSNRSVTGQLPSTSKMAPRGRQHEPVDLRGKRRVATDVIVRHEANEFPTPTRPQGREERIGIIGRFNVSVVGVHPDGPKGSIENQRARPRRMCPGRRGVRPGRPTGCAKAQ